MPEVFRYVGCVQTGPFRQDVYTARLGPGKLITDHCLIRGVNETWKPMMRTSEIEKQMASADFETFRIVIDDMSNGIHGIGHTGVGGEMTNIWSVGAGEFSIGLPQGPAILSDVSLSASYPRPTILPAPPKPRQDVVALAAERS